MKETMDFAYAVLVGVLGDIQKEVTKLAETYDRIDGKGGAYGNFAKKVNRIIEDYIDD